jgi:hypothetical protein
VTNLGEVDVPSGYPSFVTLAVRGTYTQTAGVTNLASRSTLDVSMPVSLQGGTLNLNSGAVDTPQGGLAIGAAATLNGPGAIAANVTNAGTITPGEAVGVGGTDTLYITGNYTQTGTGVLNFDIAGELPSYYNYLSIIGTATLAGTVNVTLLNGYMPPPNTGPTLMAYHSLQGQFDTLTVEGFPGGTFALLYDVNTFGVRAVYM